MSTRAAVGSAFSGRMTAATIRTASPKTRLNQKMPRQFQTPVSTPPTTGPAASANPDVAGPHADRPAARPGVRVQVAQHGQRARLAGRRAQAHHRAARDERCDVRGERAQDRAGAEDPTPASMTFFAAELVPDHPAGQHETGEGEGVRADHPLQVGHASVQAGLHGAQRDADHGVVEERQEQQRAQRPRASDRPPRGTISSSPRRSPETARACLANGPTPPHPANCTRTGPCRRSPARAERRSWRRLPSMSRPDKPPGRSG